MRRGDVPPLFIVSLYGSPGMTDLWSYNITDYQNKIRIKVTSREIMLYNRFKIDLHSKIICFAIYEYSKQLMTFSQWYFRIEFQSVSIDMSVRFEAICINNMNVNQHASSELIRLIMQLNHYNWRLPYPEVYFGTRTVSPFKWTFT